MIRIFLVVLIGFYSLLPASVLAQQVPAVETAALQNAPTAEHGRPYRINAGDELEIYVWGEERLQRAVKVLPDGTVAFPLVGRINVQGRLPGEVETLITQGLSTQYRGEVPQVTVSVVSPSGLQFSVMGRVNAPGTFTPGRYINVLEALSMAGGPSEFANLDNILIIRKSGSDLGSRRVRMSQLFKSGTDPDSISDANIPRIETGDTVIVP
jgi:polysaccharide export outer membrane protein